jgi:hypothetical protein
LAPQGASGTPGTDTSWKDISIDTLAPLTFLADDHLANLFATTPQGPWVAQSYTTGAVVSRTGKFWVAASATVAGDVPGVSSAWRELTMEAIEAQAVSKVSSVTGTAPIASSGGATPAI